MAPAPAVAVVAVAQSQWETVWNIKNNCHFEPEDVEKKEKSYDSFCVSLGLRKSSRFDLTNADAAH